MNFRHPRIPRKAAPLSYSVYMHLTEPDTHMYTPLYSAWTRQTEEGDTVLMLAVEGFNSVLEAREFLSVLIAPHVAEDLQETLH